MKILFFVLLIAAHRVCRSEEIKKINLEDIERDNLISERRSQSKEILDTEQTQHLGPPNVHQAPTGYDEQHEQSQNEVSSDEITYARPISSAHQYETQHPHHQNIQYVTIQPEDHQQYQEEREYSVHQQAPPVHEEGRTYSAPARHSLTSPILPTASATQSPYLAQQPRYVYVQAGQQQQQQPQAQSESHQEGGITYAEQQNEAVTYQQSSIPQEEGISYAEQQTAPEANGDVNEVRYAQPNHNGVATYAQSQLHTQAANTVAYEQPEQNEISYSQQPQNYAQQPQSYAHQQQYIQYVPYVSQGPSHQPYYMMVPLRGGHQYVQSRPVPLQYAQQSPYTHQQLPTVQPTVSYTHSAPEEQHAVLHAPQSTIAPPTTTSLQYPSYQSYHQPPQIQQTHYPSQVNIQQAIEYPSRHTIEYTHPTNVAPVSNVQQYQHIAHQYQPPHQQQHQFTAQPQYQGYSQGYHYSAPQLDFFGSYNKKHTSLLD